MEKILEEYLDKLREISGKKEYESEESFINLPIDENNVAEVMQAAEECGRGNVEKIVLIGIGGSSLGVNAVYHTLKGKSRLAEMIFLDQINLEKIEEACKVLESTPPEKTAIILISKSGETIETVTNYELLTQKYPKIEEDNIILITGKEAKVPSIERTKVNKILYIQEPVGGRFSIFSAAGLFPLALAGADVLQLLKGAMWARKMSLEDAGNRTIEGAENTFENFHKGKDIYNIFVFSPNLMALGYWYQQLLGESLGKRGTGIFPCVTQGSRDLHSLQQYFSGGKQNVQHEFLIHQEENQYQKLICQAVQDAYQDKEIPFKVYELPKLNEASIGEFMQQKMIETILLAKLLEVNPFGQPDVESYKEKIKEFLEHQES